jgi:OTU domain-containing protein 1
MNDGASTLSLDWATIQRRNQLTDKLLADKNLGTVDVDGDGNCLYRALAHNLTGSQSLHRELRQGTAHHYANNYGIIYDVNNLSQADYESIHNQARIMATNKEYAGEVAIKAAADYLHRDIEVYTSTSIDFPLTYHPVLKPGCHLPLNYPLRIAFYEPGHYRAVVPSCHVPASSSSSPTCNLNVDGK